MVRFDIISAFLYLSSPIASDDGFSAITWRFGNEKDTCEDFSGAVRLAIFSWSRGHQIYYLLIAQILMN